MTITIDAVYENGILKPDRPLPLKEHEKVRVTVEPGPSLAQQTAGNDRLDRRRRNARADS